MFLDSRRRLRRRHVAVVAAAVIVLAVIVAAAAAAGAALAAIAIDAARVNTAAGIESKLRACEDPGDQPFNNARGGVENAPSWLFAADLAKTVRYDQQPRRIAAVRRTPVADECDVVRAVPASTARVAATSP